MLSVASGLPDLAWILVLALLLTSCVALDKSLNISGPLLNKHLLSIHLVWSIMTASLEEAPILKKFQV